MPRTTRATRHQLEDGGKQVSPLVALDDEPRRRRGAVTKKKNAPAPAATKEEKITVASPKKPSAPAPTSAKRKAAAMSDPPAKKQKPSEPKTTADAARTRRTPAKKAAEPKQTSPSSMTPQSFPYAMLVPAIQSNFSPCLDWTPCPPPREVPVLAATSKVADASRHKLLQKASPEWTSYDLAKKHQHNEIAGIVPRPHEKDVIEVSDDVSESAEDSIESERGLRPGLYGTVLRTIQSEVREKLKEAKKAGRKIAPEYLRARNWRRMRQYMEKANQEAKVLITYRMTKDSNPRVYTKFPISTYQVPYLAFSNFLESLGRELVLISTELEEPLPKAASDSSDSEEDRSTEPQRPLNGKQTRIDARSPHANQQSKLPNDAHDAMSDIADEDANIRERSTSSPEPWTNGTSDGHSSGNESEEPEISPPRNTFPPPPKRRLGPTKNVTTPYASRDRRKMSPPKDIVSTKALAGINPARAAPAPKTKIKRIATHSGYDEQGNLILPGQEIMVSPDSNDDRNEHLRDGNSPEAVSDEHSGDNEAKPPVGLETPRRRSRTKLLMTPDAHPFANLENVPQSAKANASAPLVELEPPRTQAAPRRRWGIPHVLGKLVPFSLFGRSNLEDGSGATQGTNEQASANAKHMQVVTASNNFEDTGMNQLAQVPSEEEVKQLMVKVIQESCPDVTRPQLAASLESLLEEAKIHRRIVMPQTNEESNVQKLVTVMKQKYPGIQLSPTSLESHVKGVVSNQKVLNEYREQLAKKNHEPIPRHRLDRMSFPNAARKRKFRDTYDVIPNPKGKSFGMDLDYFCDSSSDEDEDNEGKQDADYSDHQATKRAKVQVGRTIMGRAVSQRSTEQTLTTVHTDQNSGPTPYAGNVFRAPGEAPDNIFREYKKMTAFNSTAGASPDRSAKSPSKPSGPVVFEVPSDSSDSSGDDAEVEEGYNRPKSSNEVRSHEDGNLPDNSSQLTQDLQVQIPRKSPRKHDYSDAKPEQNGKQPGRPFTHTPYKGAGASASEPSSGLADEPSGPPPAPTPSHAALPSTPNVLSTTTNGSNGSNGNNNNNGGGNSTAAAVSTPNASSSHDPVALARAQANKYAPKTSSKLKSVSRLSSSPAHALDLHGRGMLPGSQLDGSGGLEMSPSEALTNGSTAPHLSSKNINLPVSVVGFTDFEYEPIIMAAAAEEWQSVALENSVGDYCTLEDQVLQYMKAVEDGTLE